MIDFRDATKAEFDAFVEKYVERTGRKLVGDICSIGEPPLLTLNDFNLGNWPESVVAKVVLCSQGYPNDDGTVREDEYMIRKDV